MYESIRLFAERGPVMLNQATINTLGIYTHPALYQSDRFRQWQTYCQSNDATGIRAEMTRFLQSGESIKRFEDLGREWNQAIPAFLSAGYQLNTAKAKKIISESKLEGLFFKDKPAFVHQFTALADTTLALAYLKNLGDKDNIDYQSAVRIMSFTDKYIDAKMHLSNEDIRKYMLRPIYLPPCFSKIDPCEPHKTGDTRFPFLAQQQKVESAKGCISGNCACHENEDCVKQSYCCAKPRVDLIDLMVVRTYTKCFQAGDISFIKNVLDGEALSSSYRELTRTEEETETESEVRQFEERYLQTEDRNSLSSEAEDIVKTDRSLDAGLTTNSSFGAKIDEVFDLGFGTNSTTNISYDQSRTASNKAVVEYSKDVIDRATRQMEQKLRKRSSLKSLHEMEQKHDQVFNNSSGENINGQYLFVDKLSRAQVYNYGKCAAISLALPEPAALYKRLFEKKFDGIAPHKPEEIKIKPKEITEKNYEDLVGQYGLTGTPAPPALYQYTFIHFDGGKGKENNGHGVGSETNSSGVSVPNGYTADSLSSNWSYYLFNGSNVTNRYVEIRLGSESIYLDGDNSSGTTYSAGTLPYEGNQTVFLTANNATGLHFEVKVIFKIKAEKFFEWQDSVFNQIKEAYEKALLAYQKELEEYNEAKRKFEENEAEAKRRRYNKDPSMMREVEKTEIKRMVISYISCQFYDGFDAMKNRVEPCGYSEMNIKEAEEEGLFIQFFEQAFNWNLITYIIYPYFWGKKCGWGKSLAEEASDPIFEKFLQAGSCRVLVPIRNGFFDYVQYFINFGEIWGGTGTVPIPSDPHYVSLAQEIMEQNQNFNTTRLGYIDASLSANTNTVVLNNTMEYWDSNTGSVDSLKIAADIDREILIDYKTFRIVSIQLNPNATNHDSWIITLERNYDGALLTNLKWSTGAVYVGAPWEFTTPTNLIFLREKSKCLPCYPLAECKE